MCAVNISIIIPTLNEAGSIVELVRRIDFELRQNNIDYEILFIDDHSSDTTRDVVRQLASQYPIQIYLKQGNCGKAESLIEGFKRARYNLVGIIDADLQYPPEVLAEMISQTRNGYDIMVARRVDQHIPLMRRVASKLFNTIFARWLHGLHCDVQSGLKVFRRSIINEIKLSPKRWTFDLEFLLRAREYGYSIGSIDIVFADRRYGKSKVEVARAAWEIGSNALALKFKSRPPLQIQPNVHNMVGAGVAHKQKRFITHTTLPYQTSAVRPFSIGQMAIIVSLLAVVIFGLFANPLQTGIIITGILSAIYFIDVLFNLYVVRKSLSHNPEISLSGDELAAIATLPLPIYSILCPLYNESTVLPNFLDAIDKLDWPKDKLDVLLLLEADDVETIETAQRLSLPSYVRTIIVPDSLPKTKPKACNYGLNFARGEYLVIYDAEDIPDSQQLKKAYCAFQKVPRDVVCLQAKLNYHNPHQNMLTRLFTAEYSLWFDLTLTGLQSINTYIPLGGTSNHFRTADLLELKGWDPFNVTEDCDLGIRLFRHNYKTAVIDSITLEEANSNVKNWMRQRSRWMKGYMQTYLVHMRRPIEFARVNGMHALIFQLMVGGKIAFALINPFLWLATISYFTLYQIVGPTIEQLFPPIIFFMAATALVFGNFLFLYYYMIGTAKHQHWSLMKYIYAVPFYWLMTSIAAYIAFYQLLVKPHYWEKTNHGLHLAPPSIPTESLFSAPLALEKYRFAFIDTIFEPLARDWQYVCRQFLSFSYLFRQYHWYWDERGPQLHHHSPATVFNAIKNLGPRTFYSLRPLIAAGDALIKPLISSDEEISTLGDYFSISATLPTNFTLDIGKKFDAALSFIQMKKRAYLAALTAKLRVMIQQRAYTTGSLLVASMMISNVLNLLFNAFLGRMLTFQDLGLITFINTIWMVIGVFISALSSTINSQTASLATKGTQASSAYLRFVRRRSILAALAISGIWLVIAPVTAHFFNITDTWILWMFTPIWLFGFVGSANSGYLNGKMFFGDVAIVMLSESGAKLAAAIILMLAGKPSLVFLAIPLSVGLSALVSLLLINRHEQPVPNRKAAAVFDWRFYGASLVTGVSSVIFLTIDIILVKHYLNPDAAGQYSLLALVGKMIFFLGTLPNIFMITLVSRDIAMKRDPQKTFHRILSASFGLTLMAILFLLPFGHFIVPLIFGAKAVAIAPYLGLFLPAIGFLTISTVIVFYHLAKRNYLFSGIYITMAIILAAGIISRHGSIGQIVSIIFAVDLLTLTTIMLAHRLEHWIVPLFSNLIDLFGVFLPLPVTQSQNLNVRKILIFNWRDTKHVFAGGAEAYIQEMAYRWVAKGHVVTIFCGNDGKCARNDIVDGVRIVRRGGFYLVYFWAAVYYIFRFRGKYDIIIDCHNGIPFFTPLYSGKPIYCLMHHVHQEVFRRSLSKPMAWFAQFLEKRLMPVVYRHIPFITVSESSRRQIQQLGLAQAGIAIVHPGVNLNRLKPGDKSLEPTVLYLGRLKAYKSIHILLKAFVDIVTQIPRAKLVIAGSGEEEKTLKALSANLGLSNHIQFLGKVNEADKVTLLQRAWVLVNPSFMEGWGITTIEANACATPVVASNVPGLRDSIINPHTGYLVAYGDTSEFASKILEIINDTQLRNSMAQQAVKWAQRFDWQETSRAFFDIIEKEIN